MIIQIIKKHQQRNQRDNSNLLNRFVSVAGVVVTVLQCVVVVVMTALEGTPTPDPFISTNATFTNTTNTFTNATTTLYASYTSPSVSSFFLGFGTILFSFGGASTFPTIQNDMKDRTRFPVSVNIAFIGTTQPSAFIMPK